MPRDTYKEYGLHVMWGAQQRLEPQIQAVSQHMFVTKLLLFHLHVNFLPRH